jgi:hypothetical protein
VTWLASTISPCAHQTWGDNGGEEQRDLTADSVRLRDAALSGATCMRVTAEEIDCIIWKASAEDLRGLSAEFLGGTGSTSTVSA